MDEEQVFQQAVAIDSLPERTAFLDRACAGNPALRQSVEALLRSHVDAGSFLAHPPLVSETDPTLPPEEDRDRDSSPSTATGRIAPFDPAGEAELDFLDRSDKPGVLGTLGKYEVLSLIGRGGMGIVLRAYDTRLHRMVAVKVLAPELAANATARKRFAREAQAAAAVKDPNVVTIYSVEEDNRPPYLVMEIIDGKALRDKIEADGMLGVKEILRIGMQVASGLAAAHKQGLIHRDIKPANILLENGVERVKVTDFGLARAVDDVSVTRTGEVAGTPQYMSPEQARGERVDHRGDLFSLGSVLYTMCTGRPPFRGDSAIAIVLRVMEDTVRPIREVNPEIPEWLCAIVGKLMEKKPEERYQSAAEVAALLEQHLAHLQHPQMALQAMASPATLVESSEQAQARGKEAGTQARSASQRARLLAGGGLAVLMLAAGLAVAIPRITGSNGEGAAQSSGPAPSPQPVWDGWRADAPPPAVAPFNADQAKQHQEAWARYLGVPVEHTNSLGMKFRLIPPGEFIMGSTVQEMEETVNRIHEQMLAGEEVAVKQGGDVAHYRRVHEDWKSIIRTQIPQHSVILRQSFYLSVYEVTQAEYEQVMGANPAGHVPGGPIKEFADRVAGLNTRDHPVEQVTWSDAADFCRKLSERESFRPFYSRTKGSIAEEGNGYRLPTEAEWEFSCRAGTVTRYWTGDQTQQLAAAAWYEANSDNHPHPVGQLQANPFGLYDVHGNVFEWVQDWWEPTYFARFVSNPAIDPAGPVAGGPMRVVRGACFNGSAPLCHAGGRSAVDALSVDRLIGFRVALSVDAVRQTLKRPGVEKSAADKTTWRRVPASFILWSELPHDDAA